MSQRILVATDFSQSADAAWRWAVDVGRSLDADLRLVHVAMPMAAEAPSNLHQDYDRDLSLAQRLLDERAAAPCRQAASRRFSAEASRFMCWRRWPVTNTSTSLSLASASPGRGRPRG